MPPKLSKRDFGNGDQITLETALDTENISIDSILFPKATVMKLARQILAPENSDTNPMILSKDSLTVIQRASVVFVSHLYYHAKTNAKKSNRKGVNPSDIFVALEKAEFESFIPILEEELENFNLRKKAKKLGKEAAAKEGEEEDDEEEEVDDENDGTEGVDETEKGSEDGRKRAKVGNGSSKKLGSKKNGSSKKNDSKSQEDNDGHDKEDEEEEEDDAEREEEEGDDDEDDEEVAEEDGVLIAEEDDDDEEGDDDEETAPLNASQRLAKEQKELEGQSLDESTVGEEEEEEEEEDVDEEED